MEFRHFQYLIQQRIPKLLVQRLYSKCTVTGTNCIKTGGGRFDNNYWNWKRLSDGSRNSNLGTLSRGWMIANINATTTINLRYKQLSRFISSSSTVLNSEDSTDKKINPQNEGVSTEGGDDKPKDQVLGKTTPKLFLSFRCT